MIDRKPLAFYDQVLNQDVIKKKVFKERDNMLQDIPEHEQPRQEVHNMSKMSRRGRVEQALKYQETVGKRGVGILVDECRRHIDEQNQRQSMSPYRARGDQDDLSANGSAYASISARNVVLPNALSQPFL